MLSLFFGVGIGRILRYRSSNTSMVDSVSLPALFSGATALKDGTLRKKNYAEKQPGPGRRGFPADVRDPLDSALRPPQMQCPGRGFRTLRPLRGDTAGCYRPCGRLGGRAGRNALCRGVPPAEHRTARCGAPPAARAKPWKPCAALLPGCVNGVPTRCEMSNAWYGFRCPALPSRNRDGRLLLTR